ncbi:hypothetical protein HWI77_15865 [Acinetobacter venetianus]|uniref:Uncharacterized protein n=2 Tax=Acinetobacter venetianus TaxID=52133 RepID=N9A4B7_ACIVR|nr:MULTISPECIES: hypothetical protein [Acinetobacter]MDA0696966.1 hypothetical protein [Pseudomonadota bacterium]ENV38903.1 hypothetical protein F959_00033 [Acinetobacter venetianus RAG-1 = CIP 110063]ERS00265.1 membrane protein [Acinetobacter sp. COS3]KXZ72494.1 hypothetical protein AVENLUH13518_00487 [Acinetobacter venetianus]MCR4531878.1 hypothetical protein [Acinetobacter venetianus]
MQQQDHKEMFDVLAQQRQHQLLVDRVLKVVLPIVAFLLSVICANLNWQSTLGTFVILTIAFYAVGIYRLTLWHWLTVIAIYAVVDNYFSFNGIDPTRLRFQLATMLVFVGIVGIGRPYIDRWLMKSNNPK